MEKNWNFVLICPGICPTLSQHKAGQSVATFEIQTISTNCNRLSLIILQKFPFHSVKRTIMHLNQNLFSSKICYSLLGSIHCVISRLTAKSLHLLILSLLGAKTICHQLVVTGLVTGGHWSGHMCNYLTWWIWPAQWGVTDSSIVSIPGQTSCRNWQLLIKNSHDFNWSQWSSVLAPTPQINSLLRSLLPTLYL